jgi:hypothetical protein
VYVRSSAHPALALIAPPESNRHLERTQDRKVMVASFRLEAESTSGLDVRLCVSSRRSRIAGGGTMRLRRNAHGRNGALDSTHDLPTA